jgi:hypothetical protein
MSACGPSCDELQDRVMKPMLLIVAAIVAFGSIVAHADGI